MKSGKVLQALLFIVLVLASCGPKELTINDILNKNLEARGGAKYEGLKTLGIDCTMKVMGMSIPMKLAMEVPNKMRMSVNVMGKDVLTVVNGDKGWAKQNGTVSDLEKDQLDNVKKQLQDQFNIFYRVFAKSGRYKLDGKDSIDNKEVYKIKDFQKDSSFNMLYIDAKTFLETGGTQMFALMGAQKELQYEVSEFKTINGIKMPYLISFDAGEAGNFELQVDSMEVNKQFSPDVFKKPE